MFAVDFSCYKNQNMQNTSGSEDKIAFVTGAYGNLGRAVVQKFIDEGFYVVGTATQNNGDDFSSGKFEKAIVDLADENVTEKIIEEIVSKHKKIDVAVLTAGGFAMGKIADTKTSDILFQYKLNFETAYNAAKPIFLHMMQQNSGRIFLIGSKPGLASKESKGKIAYSLAKSLIFRLAELMNEEAKGKNVVVNVIVPGTIDTPPNRQSMPDADFYKWTKAEAIADIIYWYCTDEAATLRESIIKVYNDA
jgi:NAD(P)-dependent dehydrogenase (short-subunit alcohol dehydrogenase family)